MHPCLGLGLELSKRDHRRAATIAFKIACSHGELHSCLAAAEFDPASAGPLRERAAFLKKYAEDKGLIVY
jgi:hypothetical protein